MNHDTEQFWDITLDGSGFRTKFGAIGSAGDEAARTFGDAARAKAEHDKAIAQKLARGFELDDGKPRRAKPKAAKAEAQGPARNLELEKQIAKDLDDVDAFRVYGDWLGERGDPRGELIALQAKRGNDKAAAKLIAKHREHFLGDLHELSEQTLGVTWRYGFIDAVHLAKIAGGEDDDDRSTGAQLRAVLQHPSGAFVRRLSVGTADGVEDGNVHYDSVLATLDELRPKFLETVYLGQFEEFEVSWIHAGDVAALWTLPRLAKLTICAGSMTLGTIAAPELRELEIISGGLTQDCLRSISAAKWPKLEKLIVWFGSASYNATGGVADLEGLLRGKHAPALKHLGLVNAEFADELPAALAKSPLVRQLSTLDLSKGTMTSAGAAELVRSKAAFAHLAELDVSQNCIDAETAQLKRICKKVSSGKQKDPDERYVSLGE